MLLDTQVRKIKLENRDKTKIMYTVGNIRTLLKSAKDSWKNMKEKYCPCKFEELLRVKNIKKGI